MPVKKHVTVPTLGNKALEFILLNVQIGTKWKRSFVHYSAIAYIENVPHVVGLGKVRESSKEVTEKIIRIGVV